MTDYAEGVSALSSSELAVSPRPSSGLARILSLKPFGDELLTRSADFWIFCARLLILAMATAEGLAWGYMGWLISARQPWLTAAVAGAFIFVLIWIVDVSFMTLDTARGRYTRADEDPAIDQRRERLKLAGGVAGRIAIVTASLLITAPFLAQAIFAGDVRDEMTRRNSAMIASTRAGLDQTHAARIAELRRNVATLERERVAEAAGVGPSGRYGRGPALETIERQLAETREQLAAAETARAAALERFDALSPAELGNRYGIQLLSPGINSSGIVLEGLLSNPQFNRAEIAVRAFLAFLFLGLLILKLFQPRSVAVYYSEELHSLHDEWERGLFDAYLPAAERSDNGRPIDPLRFEEWCRTTWLTIRQEEDRHRRMTSEVRGHEVMIDQWRRIETITRDEIEQLETTRSRTAATIAELERELRHATQSARDASGEMEEIERRSRSLQAIVTEGKAEGPAFERAMEALAALSGRRDAVSGNLRNQEDVVASASGRLGELRLALSRLEEQISASAPVLEDAGRRIRDARLACAETVGRQRPPGDA